MVWVVALAPTAAAVFATYQEREKGRERERGKKKQKQQNNKRAPCDQTRGLLLVLFEHLQNPGTWPYLS